MTKLNVMKFSICMCLLCLILGITSQSASADERSVEWTDKGEYSYASVEKDGIHYCLTDWKDDKYSDYAFIEDYGKARVSTDGVLLLPAEITYQKKTYPVIGIMKQNELNEEIREVVVPEEFGKTDVQLPDDESAIFDREIGKGQRNFFVLPNVSKVTIRAKKICICSLYWDGDGYEFGFDKAYASSGKEKLEQVVMESEQIHASRYAFSGMSNLKEISVKAGSSITLDASSIVNCKRLKKVQLPAGTDYHEGAILKCTALTSMEIEDGGAYQNKNRTLSRNGTLLFVPSDCISYQTDADINRIGDLAFANCSKLKKVSTNAAEIGKGAFFRCRKLSQINLKKTKSIENTAFALTGIQKITLPSSLKKMGYGVFFKTNSLKSIKASGKYFRVKDGNLLSKDGKKLYAAIPKAGKVRVPDGVRTIYTMPISNAASVKEIILPASLKKTGSLCGMSKKLKKIKFLGKKPPEHTYLNMDFYDSAFYHVIGDEGSEAYMLKLPPKRKLTVVVPNGAKKKYREFLRSGCIGGAYKKLSYK